jgi:phosphoesterase RecJ-like protein
MINTIANLKPILSKLKKIVIVTHKNPDGDAIGSSLGLKHILATLNAEITVVTPNDYPEFLKWMPNESEIVKFDTQTDLAKEKVKEAELIFCLDFNTLKRIEDLGLEVEKSQAQKVLIDHHPGPDDFYDYALHTIKASSTCELIVTFSKEMGFDISSNAASCLYTGLVTDTGSFRFSMNPKVHEYAGLLLEKGAEIDVINNQIFESNNKNRLSILGKVLSTNNIFICDDKASIMFLTEKDVEELDIQAGDSEGIVNYPLSVKTCRLSVLVSTRNGEVRMSFRSKYNIPANRFAREYFSGGGHLNAAGGTFSGSVMETVERVKEVVKENESWLDEI